MDFDTFQHFVTFLFKCAALCSLYLSHAVLERGKSSRPHDFSSWPFQQPLDRKIRELWCRENAAHPLELII